MRYIVFILLIVNSLSTFSQEQPDIVEIIDDLTVKWDVSSINLRNYQGIQEFCLTKEYRKKTIDLLDAIHHWDTTLYFIVQDKFDTDKDQEAAATLLDIEKLETEYSTENFKNFIADECGSLKVIQENFDSEKVKQYEKEIKKFEKELIKYIKSITYRIDIIDEHIHHLDFD